MIECQKYIKRLELLKKMYKRVLLKLSGEAMAGEKKTGIDPDVVDSISDKIIKMTKEGIQVGVVTGGGNFWRGRTSTLA